MNELQEKIARLPMWAREHIKRLEIRSEPAMEEAARCRRQLGEAQEKMRRLSDANAALMELLSKAGRQGLNWADEVVRTLEGYEIFKAVATERAEGDDK